MCKILRFFWVSVEMKMRRSSGRRRWHWWVLSNVRISSGSWAPAWYDFEYRMCSVSLALKDGNEVSILTEFCGRGNLSVVLKMALDMTWPLKLSLALHAARVRRVILKPPLILFFRECSTCIVWSPPSCIAISRVWICSWTRTGCVK